MPQLPPGYSGDDNDDLYVPPFDRSEYHEWGLDEHFLSYDIAVDAAHALENYMQGNGSSWDIDHWLHALQDVHNVRWDDDGYIHFDFEWDDGVYHGKGSV